MCLCPPVFIQIALGLKGDATGRAREGPFARVGPDVFLQHTGLQAVPATVWAQVLTSILHPACADQGGPHPWGEYRQCAYDVHSQGWGGWLAHLGGTGPFRLQYGAENEWYACPLQAACHQGCTWLEAPGRYRMV